MLVCCTVQSSLVGPDMRECGCRLVEACAIIEKEFGRLDMERVAATGRIAELLLKQGKAAEALQLLESVKSLGQRRRSSTTVPNGAGRRWWEAKEEGSESGWEAFVRSRWLERMGDLQLQLGDGTAAMDSYEQWQTCKTAADQAV